MGRGRAFLPHPCHHKTEEYWGQFSQGHNFGAGSPNALTTALALYPGKVQGPWAVVSMGKGQLPHLPWVTGSKQGERLSLAFTTPVQRRGGVASFTSLTPSELSHQTTANRVISSVLPRQGEGPTSLSAMDGNKGKSTLAVAGWEG